MDLFEVLRPECIGCRLDLQSKRDVIQRVVRLAKASSLCDDISEGVILEKLNEREEQGSTGIGGRIALPHCRVEGIDGFVAGLITLETPVDFGAADGEPVEVVVFIIGPEEKSNEYIRILSSVSQVFSIPGALKELLFQRDAERLRETFLRYTRDEAEFEKKDKRGMFHVIIQNEDWFQDILQVFEGLGSSRTIVVNVEAAGSYLSKMPLFAGLWSDSAGSYCQVIVAVVSERAVNEIIRRIDRITGGLDQCSEVMVCVHELMLCRGCVET